MSGTYTQIQIHIVFSVKRREPIILGTVEEKIYKFISGVVKKNGHKLLQINGMPDHVHLLVSMNPNQSISDLVKGIKQSSSHMINCSGQLKNKFAWQPGYAAFSCSRSHALKVIDYIKNQKQHHRTKTFMSEYKMFLDLNNIDYDPRYL